MWCSQPCQKRTSYSPKPNWYAGNFETLFDAVYRQCAVCCSDFWSAYEELFPQLRDRAVGKESGKTNSIERFNLSNLIYYFNISIRLSMCLVSYT
jgi:hypothetical protein